MNERMIFNPDEAAVAGQADAHSLLLSIKNGCAPSGQLNDAISEIVALAIENRVEECEARKVAFCEIIGPALRDGADAHDQLKALQTKCASLSLRQAEAYAAGLTESEGGEL